MTRCATFLSAIIIALGAAACGNTGAGIMTNVKSKLAADDSVRALDINVTTQEGVVTLRGDVDSSAARDVAIRIARDTEGLRDVVDELRIEMVGTTGDGDDDIDVEVDVDDDIERGARKAGKAIEEGARETGEAIRDTGKRVRDAVTDRDHDSDRDGK